MTGPGRPWPRWLKTALPLLGSALLLSLFWANRGEELVAALAEARLWLLAAAVLCFWLGLFLNGLPWRHLVQAAGLRISLPEMIRLDLGSMFWGTVLPGSVGGEIIKATRLAEGIARIATVAMALVASRLVGAGAAASAALLLLPFSAAGPALRSGIGLSCALLVGVAAAGLLLRQGPDLVGRFLPQRVLDALRRRLPPGQAPPAAALARAWALAIPAHLAFSAVYALSSAAVGAPVGWPDAAWIYVLTSLAQALPITLAGLGARELTVTAALGLLDPSLPAAAAAVGVTAAHLLTALVGGLAELLRALWPPR